MNRPLSRKNTSEMSPERDIANAPAVGFRYCNLSSRRAGSTLIARILHKTGVAGDPLEYFNRSLLNIECQRNQLTELDWMSFLARMQQRRTSPNGYFGMTVHYNQWRYAFGFANKTISGLAFLRQQDALLWLRRRDRVAQAVSLALALHTRVWSSEDPAVAVAESDISLDALLEAYACSEADDLGWQALISQAGLPVLEVWHEDVVADYEAQIRRILSHLRLSEQVPNIPPPPLEKQANLLSERLGDKLRRALAQRDTRAE